MHGVTEIKWKFLMIPFETRLRNLKLEDGSYKLQKTNKLRGP
jgi:hypothetical protein